MPMPHRTQMQLIKRRLVGKEGSERIRELRTILGELPGYKNGPYADIRKWVEAQLDQTRVRKRVTHRDSIAVRREGAAQIALVGPPNAGKSSLLQALSKSRSRRPRMPSRRPARCPRSHGSAACSCSSSRFRADRGRVRGSGRRTPVARRAARRRRDSLLPRRERAGGRAPGCDGRGGGGRDRTPSRDRRD